MSSSPICINGSTRHQGFSPGRQTMKSKYVCLCQFQLQVLKILSSVNILGTHISIHMCTFYKM
jgi:hypothetical protein